MKHTSIEEQGRIQNLYSLTFIVQDRSKLTYPLKIKKMEFVLKRKEKQGSQISV